jgi:hypothetical protein
MILVSFEDQEFAQNGLLQAVSEISLEDLEHREKSLYIHLCDWLGIEEEGNISELCRIVLLDQSEQVLLSLSDEVPSLCKLVDDRIDS